MINILKKIFFFFITQKEIILKFRKKYLIIKSIKSFLHYNSISRILFEGKFS